MALNWKITQLATTTAASFVAGKAVEASWKLVTGKDIPSDDDNDVKLLTSLGFAIVTAVAVTVAQRYASRGAKKIYARRYEGKEEFPVA